MIQQCLFHQDQMYMAEHLLLVYKAHQASEISSLAISLEDLSTYLIQNATLSWKEWKDATKTTQAKTQLAPVNTIFKVSKEWHAEGYDLFGLLFKT